MRDPVTLFQSGLTYDRESLCKSLLNYPKLCPSSNQTFDEKLQYVPNMTAPQLLMLYLGDEACQPYDDSDFDLPYGALWNEEGSDDILDADELLNLGLQYETGEGRPQDYGQARHYYELAANQGHTDAQFCLGYLYYTGHSVAQDYELVRHYYELAADQGSANAQYHLGRIYRYGWGVTQDQAMAFHFYKLAADQPR